MIDTLSSRFLFDRFSGHALAVIFFVTACHLAFGDPMLTNGFFAIELPMFAVGVGPYLQLASALLMQCILCILLLDIIGTFAAHTQQRGYLFGIFLAVLGVVVFVKLYLTVPIQISLPGYSEFWFSWGCVAYSTMFVRPGEQATT